MARVFVMLVLGLHLVPLWCHFGASAALAAADHTPDALIELGTGFTGVVPECHSLHDSRQASDLAPSDLAPCAGELSEL